MAQPYTALVESIAASAVAAADHLKADMTRRTIANSQGMPLPGHRHLENERDHREPRSASKSILEHDAEKCERFSDDIML
ncbi:hypothetical protein [Rhizobium acidisoli]|uniref:hypothetical protein n=1 Tax=Rhizobium acidisoli TaxID=1538158 RepID=UPI0006BA324E|nr:hypothetical protein [Rhizobium acidisoli]KPH05517.1 hypothetical protein AOG23_27295 [Rhizobium acidisoli]